MALPKMSKPYNSTILQTNQLLIYECQGRLDLDGLQNGINKNTLTEY